MKDVDPGSGGTALIEAARRAIEEAPAPADGVEVARAVAADLAAFYRDRLRRVVLFGSFARGEADEDSDVDLLVVLDRVDDEWKEFDRLLDLTWERVLSSGRAISPYPVTDAELTQSDKPYLVRARQEGRDVTW
ncbi:MAG: nucleotidyltransferase domain-containing protein [Acidimicrobiia bacterium]